MTELKPCALCGGAGKYHGSYFEDDVCEYVSCTKCNASTPLMYKKGESIEWWNRRANPWHTGTPTEEGLYIVYYCDDHNPLGVEYEAICDVMVQPVFDDDGELECWVNDDRDVRFEADDIIRWQKIEPYKEAIE